MAKAGMNPGLWRLGALHAELGARLVVEPTGLLQAFGFLIARDRGPGARSHSAVDRARVVALVLQGLLQGRDALMLRAAMVLGTFGLATEHPVLHVFGLVRDLLSGPFGGVLRLLVTG